MPLKSIYNKQSPKTTKNPLTTVLTATPSPYSTIVVMAVLLPKLSSITVSQFLVAKIIVQIPTWTLLNYCMNHTPHKTSAL